MKDSVAYVLGRPGDYAEWPYPESVRRDYFVTRRVSSARRDYVTVVVTCPTEEAARAAIRLLATGGVTVWGLK